MQVTIGKEGLTKSWQGDFPETNECPYCKGEARIAFVGHEGLDKQSGEGPYVCSLHKNNPEGEGYWLHDACAVAVYFCKKCLEVSGRYTQG
jgi:hypothetical protein